MKALILSASNKHPHSGTWADVSICQMNTVRFRGQLVTLKINLILVWTRFTLNPGTVLPQHAKTHLRGASFFFFHNSDKVMTPVSVYSTVKSLGSINVSVSPQDWYHWPVCKIKGCSLRIAGLALQKTLSHPVIYLTSGKKNPKAKQNSSVSSVCWRNMTLIIVLNLFCGTSLHLRVKETQLKEFCERAVLWRWRSGLLSTASPLKRCCPPPTCCRRQRAAVSLSICVTMDSTKRNGWVLHLIRVERWDQIAARGCLSIM